MSRSVGLLTAAGVILLLVSLLVANVPSGQVGFSLFGLDAVPGTPLAQINVSDGILLVALASFGFDILIFIKEK